MVPCKNVVQSLPIYLSENENLLRLFCHRKSRLCRISVCWVGFYSFYRTESQTKSPIRKSWFNLKLYGKACSAFAAGHPCQLLNMDINRDKIWFYWCNLLDCHEYIHHESDQDNICVIRKVQWQLPSPNMQVSMKYLVLLLVALLHIGERWRKEAAGYLPFNLTYFQLW